MRITLIILFSTLFFNHSYAQVIGEMDYGMYDYTFRYENHDLQVRRIPKPDFEHLRIKHELSCLVEGITDLAEVQKVLGEEYSIIYEQRKNYDIIFEITKKDKNTFYFGSESGFPFIYYPEFKILGYVSGHECDRAIHIDTGEETSAPSRVSPDKTLLLTAMFSGQDNEEYEIWKWDTSTHSYSKIASLRDIISHASHSGIGSIMYIYNPFWVNNRLYFKTYEGKCASITVL